MERDPVGLVRHHDVLDEVSVPIENRELRRRDPIREEQEIAVRRPCNPVDEVTGCHDRENRRRRQGLVDLLDSPAQPDVDQITGERIGRDPEGVPDRAERPADLGAGVRVELDHSQVGVRVQVAVQAIREPAAGVARTDGLGVDRRGVHDDRRRPVVPVQRTAVGYTLIDPWIVVGRERDSSRGTSAPRRRQTA